MVESNIPSLRFKLIVFWHLSIHTVWNPAWKQSKCQIINLGIRFFGIKIHLFLCLNEINFHIGNHLTLREVWSAYLPKLALSFSYLDGRTYKRTNGPNKRTDFTIASSGRAELLRTKFFPFFCVKSDARHFLFSRL